MTVPLQPSEKPRRLPAGRVRMSYTPGVGCEVEADLRPGAHLTLPGMEGAQQSAPLTKAQGDRIIALLERIEQRMQRGDAGR